MKHTIRHKTETQFVSRLFNSDVRNVNLCDTPGVDGVNRDY
jgi:hypothetical protein